MQGVPGCRQAGGVARVILPSKKKKASGEEPEAPNVSQSKETHTIRVERVGDNLFIWRRAIQRAASRG